MKAKYNATGNYLEEQVPPELDPAVHDANAHPDLYDEYKAVRASLRRIPCHPSCVGKWSDGQEVEEGKDYEVRRVCGGNNGDGCFAHDVCDKCTMTAFPLPVKSEDDLWKEFLAIVASIHSRFGSNIVKFGFKKASDILLQESAELKQKYSLTKK